MWAILTKPGLKTWSKVAITSAYYIPSTASLFHCQKVDIKWYHWYTFLEQGNNLQHTVGDNQIQTKKNKLKITRPEFWSLLIAGHLWTSIVITGEWGPCQELSENSSKRSSKRLASSASSRPAMISSSSSPPVNRRSTPLTVCPRRWSVTLSYTSWLEG